MKAQFRSHRLVSGGFCSLLLTMIVFTRPCAGNGFHIPEWEPLLENDLPRAVTEFRKGEKDLRETKSHEWGLAANGLALAYWSLGDYFGAAEMWMELCEWSFTRPTQDSPLRSAAFLEGYLACLRRAMNYVRVDEDLVPLLERLESEGEEPDKKRLVDALLFELYRRNGDVDGVKRLGETLGLVTRWDAVVGPFGHSGVMDLEETLEPERNPSEGPFHGYLREVRWRKVPFEQPDGYLDLSNLIHPTKGIAYARTAVHSSESIPGLLTIESKSSLRLWWNSHLVLSRDRADLDLERITTIPVQIDAGMNYLMVKSRHQGSAWGCRLWVRPSDLASTAEITPASSESYPSCHPDNQGCLAAREAGPVERIPTASREMDAVNLLARIHAAEVLRRNRHYAAAQENLEMVLQEKPEWCLPLTLLGDVCWEAAGDRPGSRTRLESQARSSFESALEASPHAIPAAIGLGEYFRALKTFDSALEVLERAQMTVAGAREAAPDNDPPALQNPLPSLDYELARVYEDLEYEIEARRAYSRCCQDDSGNPDAWVRLSDLLGRSGASMQSFAVAEEGNRMFPLNSRLITRMNQAAEEAGQEQRMAPVFDRRLNMYPTDLAIHAARATVFEKLARWEEALQAYEKMKTINPARALPFIRSGNYLLQITDITSPAEAGRIAQAVEHLRAGLERSPQDLDLRRRIHAAEESLGRSSGRKTPPETKALPDEYYDLDYFDLDQSRLEELPQEKANAVYLLDLMVETLFPNGTRTSLVHQSVLLKTKEGRDEFSEISVPRGAEILLARTIIPGGTVYHAETITDTGTDQSVSMYGLEDGCVVDYAYRTTSSSIPSPGEGYQSLTYHFGDVTNPMLLSRLVMLIYDGVDLRWKAHPLDFGPQVEQGSGYEVWTWEKTLSPGIKRESSLPPKSLIVPTVKTTTCLDWSVGVKRAKSWFKGRREEEDKLAEVASLLALDVNTTEEKVAKVYEYIQRVIEPGNVSGGTVIDTLKNRSGTAFDKAVLAQALLEHMGVRSHIGLGHDPGEEHRFPPLPSSSYLTGSLLLVPGDQDPEAGALVHPKDRWISFSSRYLPLGETRSSHRAQVTFLFLPHGVMTRLPLDAGFEGGWVERQLALELAPPGESACKGAFSYHGDIRSGLRQAIMDQTLRERVLSSEVTRTLRGIELDQGAFSGVDQLDENIAITFQGKVTGLLQPRETGWSLDAIVDKSDLSASAPEPQREQPVRFDDPVIYNPYRASFRLPPPSTPDDADWVFQHIPEDTVLISRFGCFSLDYELQGDTLWVSRAAYVPAQWIETEDYPEFIDFCRSVDSAENEPVSIGLFEWQAERSGTSGIVNRTD